MLHPALLARRPVRSSSERERLVGDLAPATVDRVELALRHGETIDELREAIRSATEESDRLAQLAEDLLLVAQTDQGTLALKIETLSASDLLETIAARYRWRAEDASVEFATDAPLDLTLTGDRIRLEQALGNLVDNAIRHANNTVTLSARNNDSDVELNVQDDGAGFAPSFLDHAFERFSRADSARGRGGIGLGLSIVEAIAHAHDGHTYARNQPGGGADVAIVLGHIAPTDGRQPPMVTMEAEHG